MDEIIDITKLNQIHIDSYMSKQEFINLINNMKFTHIKNFDIDFITGFEYDTKDNKTLPRGYNIKYEWEV